MSKTSIDKKDGIKLGFEYDRDKVISEFLPKIDESPDHHLYWDKRYNYAYIFDLKTLVMYKATFTEAPPKQRVHYKTMKIYSNRKMEWIYGMNNKYYDRQYYRVYRTHIKIWKSNGKLIYRYDSNMKAIIRANDRWEMENSTD